MKTQQAQPKTQPERHAGNKMDIDVKINSISMEGNILATASINLNQCLAIRNVRLMNGEKGMFLSMPSYRTGNGEFREFRTQMTEALTSAYKEALTIQQGKMAQMAESPVPQMAPAGLSM